jgi:acetoin utilization deacetylase AcuC-like enzyme
LFTDEVEAVIKQVFELVNPDGSYHRYDPAKAIRPLKEMFDPKLANLRGTYQVCLEALERRFCFYFGGGAHHAHPGFGHGFCVLNDSGIALRRLQAENRIRRAWVIDVDAHKGDGTADIFSGDPSVITVSVNMARGWPLDGPERLPNGALNPAFIPSDIDVPVDAGEEAQYVPRLADALERLASHPKPDLALVLLGADPYEHDELPSTSLLKLTLEQLGERDRLIYEFLAARGIPHACLMAGGYGVRAWEPYAKFLRFALYRELGIGLPDDD